MRAGRNLNMWAITTYDPSLLKRARKSYAYNAWHPNVGFWRYSGRLRKIGLHIGVSSVKDGEQHGNDGLDRDNGDPLFAPYSAAPEQQPN